MESDDRRIPIKGGKVCSRDLKSVTLVSLSTGLRGFCGAATDRDRN